MPTHLRHAARLATALFAAGALATCRGPSRYESTARAHVHLRAGVPSAELRATVTLNAEGDVSGAVWQVHGYTELRAVGACPSEDARSVVSLTVAAPQGRVSGASVLLAQGLEVGGPRRWAFPAAAIRCSTAEACAARYDVRFSLDGPDGGSAPACAAYELEFTLDGVATFSTAPPHDVGIASFLALPEVAGGRDGGS